MDPDRVTQLRESNGLSRSDLAAACGVTWQAIQQLESGDVKQPRYLYQLAAALKTSPAYLLRETNNPDPDHYAAKSLATNGSVRHNMVNKNDKEKRMEHLRYRLIQKIMELPERKVIELAAVWLDDDAPDDQRLMTRGQQS